MGRVDEYAYDRESGTGDVVSFDHYSEDYWVGSRYVCTYTKGSINKVYALTTDRGPSLR